MSAPPRPADPSPIHIATMPATPCTSKLSLWKQRLKAGRAELFERYDQGAPIADLVLARSQLIDTVLSEVWDRFLGDTADAALVAVGGYGRQELHPASDIDILIIVEPAADAALAPALEQLVTTLWDIGLDVGHSVRTPPECAREAAGDVTVMTNLLEARLLRGSRALCQAMREATAPERFWDSAHFFAAKTSEQRARWQKYGGTAYNLEPNIKENPGGLRDIQMIGWVAKRHFGADTLHELVGHGFLTESEYQTLIAGQTLLWRIRFSLHRLAGRREDRLLFDYQRTLAQQFGFEDGGNNLAVEQLMQQYYRTVQELNRLNEMLLQLFREAILLHDAIGPPVPINRRFQARSGYLEVTAPTVFQRWPIALLELFHVLQVHPQLDGVRASTIRLIRENRHRIDDDFRADLRARSLFMEILRHPSGLSQALRRMNATGSWPPTSRSSPTSSDGCNTTSCMSTRSTSIPCAYCATCAASPSPSTTTSFRSAAPSPGASPSWSSCILPACSMISPRVAVVITRFLARAMPGISASSMVCPSSIAGWWPGWSASTC